MKYEKKKEKFSGLKNFFTCPLFSKKKADELREVASESEKISDRIETVESSVKQLEKLLKKSIKDLLKEQKALSRKMQREGDDLGRSIEKSLDSLRSDIVGQTTQVQLFQKTASSKVDSAIQTVSDVGGNIRGIRNHFAESNQLFQRLQDGYDYQILKNFVRQIARSISNLEKKIAASPDGDVAKELVDARDDLVELLERNGVDQINPSLDSSYTEIKKYAEVIQEKEKTDDPQKRGLIASVERVGFKYEFNDGQERVIQVAQVKLYE